MSSKLSKSSGDEAGKRKLALYKVSRANDIGHGNTTDYILITNLMH